MDCLRAASSQSPAAAVGFGLIYLYRSALATHNSAAARSFDLLMAGYLELMKGE